MTAMANRKDTYDALFDAKTEVESSYRTADLEALLQNLIDAATRFQIVVDRPTSMASIQKYLEMNVGTKIPYPAREALRIHLNSVFTYYTELMKAAGFED